MFSALFKDLSWVKRTVRSHKTSLQLDNMSKKSRKSCSKKRKKNKSKTI